MGFSTCWRSRRRAPTPGMRPRCVPFALVIAGLLGWGGVDAQYDYVGKVAMDCGDCDCTGTSDDGTIIVLDNPSSGDRMAYVEGEYSEILETSCGSSVIAVGTNLYELTGVDLDTRDLEEMVMDDSDCTTNDTPSTAECYSGESSRSLDGGVDLTLTLCLCRMDNDGKTVYKSSVKGNVQGSDTVVIPTDGVVVCLDREPKAQLVTAVVEDTEYLYNFGIVISGETSFGDLDVSSAPTSEADDSACSVDGSETISSVTAYFTSSSSSLSPAPVPASPAPIQPEPEPTPFPTIQPSTTSTYPPTSAADREQPKPEATSPPQLTSPTEAPAVVSAATPSPVSAVGTDAPAPGRADAPTAEAVASTNPSTVLSSTPAPTVNNTTGPPMATSVPTSAPRATATYGEFDDKRMTVRGRGGLAFLALAIFAILTFLPTNINK